MELQCVFSTNDESEAMYVKDLLESHEIDVMVRNQFTQNLFGTAKIFSGVDPVAGSIEVFVDEKNVDQSLEILCADIRLSPNLKDDCIEQDNIDEIESIGNTEDEESDEFKYKRAVLFAYWLTAISFVIIPILVNIPNLVRIYRKRKSVFWMLAGLNLLFPCIALVVILKGLYQ
jgi:hypothetical protein